MPRPNKGPQLVQRPETGLWEIVWYERGRRRRSATGTGDRREAEKALGRFLLKAEPVGPRDPSQRRIADVLDDYLKDREDQVVAVEQISYAVSALLPFFGALRVDAVKKTICQAYARQRERSDSTVRRELSVLRAAINHDYSEGRLIAPVPVWLPARPDNKDRWLTRKEAAALLWAAKKDRRSRLHLPLFILMGLYTAARKEAILSLRWPQVDLERGLIDFNPPGRERTSKGRPIIPIPRHLMTFLRLARARGSETGYVISYSGRSFKSRTVNPIKPRPVKNIQHGFNTACKNAGLQDVTPHTLRHTSASWMAQARVPFPEIARYLGHTDSRTTERIYAHHTPEYLAAAAKALDRR